MVRAVHLWLMFVIGIFGLSETGTTQNAANHGVTIKMQGTESFPSNSLADSLQVFANYISSQNLQGMKGDTMRVIEMDRFNWRQLERFIHKGFHAIDISIFPVRSAQNIPGMEGIIHLIAGIAAGSDVSGQNITIQFVGADSILVHNNGDSDGLNIIFTVVDKK